MKKQSEDASEESIDQTIQDMINTIKESPQIYHPSLYWEDVARTNLEQIKRKGFENFKRTINQNYFNYYIISPFRTQFMKLMLRWLASTPNLNLFRSKFGSDKYLERYGKERSFDKKSAFFYKMYVTMLWDYTKTQDREKILSRLEEPTEGNPIIIHHNGKLISQDICNSTLEYYTIMQHIPDESNHKMVVAEIGAGYGRNAYIFLNASKCKYIIFDIPPALYVSQRYLSAVFPNRRIFKFRKFNDFSEIKKEYENSDICFFTPNQINLLPEKQFDIMLNISSLHEMTFEQIQNYFALIGRYCKGYFFTKQWTYCTNVKDNLTLTYKDYPVPESWERIYFRKSPLQSRCFEAIYKIK